MIRFYRKPDSVFDRSSVRSGMGGGPLLECRFLVLLGQLQVLLGDSCGKALDDGIKGRELGGESLGGRAMPSNMPDAGAPATWACAAICMPRPLARSRRRPEGKVTASAPLTN
jgi:hypothetical protein